MSGQVRRSLALALVGLLGGLGLVAALFGGKSVWQLTGRRTTETPGATAPGEAARALADPGLAARRPDPSGDRSGDASGRAGPGAPPRADASAEPPRDAGALAALPGKPGAPTRDAAAVPRFDIVRVEPNGEAVVAGRGAPHAVVEMLVNGKPVAQATADASGQFAVVPPSLPPGSSQIRLRMTGKDGRAAESEQSVAVEVAPGRDRQPLVALTTPDAATVVLSQPGAPGAGAGAAPAQTTRIVSADVQENGRLFVTATGTPGATLRLYLNDTLIAPGRIGSDGHARFTIGRGMKPGQYEVRIDQIDPATGKVETRAEVPLAVPEPTRMAGREPAGPHAPTARGSAQSDASTDTRGGTQAGGQGSSNGSPAGNATGGTRAAPERAGAPRHQAPTASHQAPAGSHQAPAAPTQALAAASDPRRAAAEADADSAAGSVYVPEINTAKITRGDNLWRISQRTYGRGGRYTVIYDANQTQIRNPDLIYPGQIFVLPEDKRG